MSSLANPPQLLLGRGTMRSMVEGAAVAHRRWRGGPSTVLRTVPLPEKSRGGFPS